MASHPRVVNNHQASGRMCQPFTTKRGVKGIEQGPKLGLALAIIKPIGHGRRSAAEFGSGNEAMVAQVSGISVRPR
ncbi:hypothetical protein NL676_001896 [Syzygium grande]|nr:hypothetical protein NL676_001896 [Syzygium grande]